MRPGWRSGIGVCFRSLALLGIGLGMVVPARAAEPTWFELPAVSHRGQESAIFAEVLALVATERGVLPPVARVVRRFVDRLLASRPPELELTVAFRETDHRLRLGDLEIAIPAEGDLGAIATTALPGLLHGLSGDARRAATEAYWYLWIDSFVKELEGRHNHYVTVDALTLDTASLRGRRYAIGLTLRHTEGRSYVERVDDQALSTSIPIGAEITSIDSCPLERMTPRELSDYWLASSPFSYDIEARFDGEVVRAHGYSVARRDHTLRSLLYGDVLYVRIDHFGAETIIELRRALRRLARVARPRLLLDVRGNPGGVRAVDVVDCFLPPDRILASVRFLDDDTVAHTTGSVERYDFPLAVLLDRQSASASEVLAAAIQVHHRGVLVGDRSFGKAVGQTARPVLDEGRLWLVSTVLYYPGTSATWADDGVCPEIQVQLTSAESLAVAEWLDDSSPVEELPLATDPALREALRVLEGR